MKGKMCQLGFLDLVWEDKIERSRKRENDVSVLATIDSTNTQSIQLGHFLNYVFYNLIFVVKNQETEEAEEMEEIYMEDYLSDTDSQPSSPTR